MPETVAAPSPPAKHRRTWLPMALWTAGILLALGLAWFIGAVVVPVWRVRALLDDERNYFGIIEGGVAKLGGPERAARPLSIYMRLPEKLAPHKHTRANRSCGQQSHPGAGGTPR
jgi:hypothetical protein